MKYSAGSIGFSAFIGLAFAGSVGAYQFEGTGTYTDFDDQNDSSLGVSAEFHFANVDDSGVPRAEAAFLRRSSNVKASFSTRDKVDSDAIGLSAEAYINSLYLRAGLTRTEAGSTESDDPFVEVGFLPAQGLRLSLQYEDFDLADQSRVSVNAKMVRPLSGAQAMNLTARVSQRDDANDTVTYRVGGDYYVNHDLSFGLNYADTDAKNSREVVTLRARMFFIPTLSAQVAYSMQDLNDRITLGVTGRF
ncbi:MAG: putative porin [Oceanococcus sp.]